MNRETILAVGAAAVIGASVAVLGVALFEHAYPHRWTGNDPNLTPLVALVYFLGAITTFWCLFTAVASFKSRNDPGGTVRLEITRGGETRVVEVDREDLPGAIEEATGGDVSVGDGSGGTVGVVGRDPDGSVPTQTNVAERTAGAVRDAALGTGDPGPGGPTPASDGGATEPGIRTPADDAEVMYPRSEPAETTDTYCGNCEQFRYVQTSRGMRPFCELDDGVMDDMDACDRWEPNRMD
jgi:hypothetical protein